MTARPLPAHSSKTHTRDEELPSLLDLARYAYLVNIVGTQRHAC